MAISATYYPTHFMYVAYINHTWPSDTIMTVDAHDRGLDTDFARGRGN